MKVKFRHRVLRFVLAFLIRPIAFILYGFRTKVINEKKLNLRAPYLILSTHYAQLDPFLLELSFPRHIYFVANDDIFNNRFLAPIIRYLVSPIPISKGIPDVNSILMIRRLISQKACVGIFPEGNTSYTGVTGHISPAIGKLIKLLKVTIVFYRFDGLYFIAPRWAKYKNKGRSKGYVSKIVEFSEFEGLSSEEVYDIVKTNLNYNNYEIQKNKMIKYKGKRKAENLEKILYQCPKCKSYASLKSDKNNYTCCVCNYHLTVDDYGFFIGDEVFYDNVYDWYNFQIEELKKIDFTSISNDEVLCIEKNVHIYKGQRHSKKNKLGSLGTFTLFKNRLEYSDKELRLVINLDKIQDIIPSKKNAIFIYLNNEEIYKISFPYNSYIIMIVNFFHAILNHNRGGNYEYMGL